MHLASRSHKCMLLPAWGQLGMVKSSGLLGLGSLSCFLAVNLSRGFVTKTGLSITAMRPARRACTTTMRVYSATAGSTLLDAMTAAITEATGSPCSLSFSDGGGYSGGGGASVGTVKDTKSGVTYFFKSAGTYKLDMLNAEYKGIKEMHESKTIKVPEPIAVGTSDNNAFVVFEYLAMGGSRGGRIGELMGKQLALMHKKTSTNGMYGFDIDNTIGATPQPNKWTKSWADFFVEHRLGHMFKLCRRDGATFTNEKEVLEKVRGMLEAHKTVPSLLHGDLWTGNAGVTSDGEPVIFDPATYYGDREADLAMTYLFGAFPDTFYEGYEEEWPLPPGFENRRTIYNLYHILNHYVLFGGGYAPQAQRMMDQIMKMNM